MISIFRLTYFYYGYSRLCAIGRLEALLEAPLEDLEA
jgi:hypothetical protein